MRIFYVFVGKGGFTMRRYDPIKHECSQCGMLCDYKSFKTHTETECFMIEMKNKQLEDELKKGEKNEVSTM